MGKKIIVGKTNYIEIKDKVVLLFKEFDKPFDFNGNEVFGQMILFNSKNQDVYQEVLLDKKIDKEMIDFSTEHIKSNFDKVTETNQGKLSRTTRLGNYRIV